MRGLGSMLPTTSPVGVTPLTPSACLTVLRVLLGRAGVQMIRTAAWRIVATVAHEGEPRGRVAVRVDVGEPVRASGSVQGSNSTVAVFVSHPHPWPAAIRIGSVYFLPEVLWRSGPGETGTGVAAIATGLRRPVRHGRSASFARRMKAHRRLTSGGVTSPAATTARGHFASKSIPHSEGRDEAHPLL